MQDNFNDTDTFFSDENTSVRFDAVVIPPLNTFENIDCMEMLRKCPPKHFDLAIVDPPYGNVAVFNNCQPLERKNERPQKYIEKDWDSSPPPQEYFEQLFRVSKNQIVWGGNYFTDKLPTSRGWIYWDKNNGENNFSDGELAWTSFTRRLMSFKKNSKAETRGGRDRIHPTQKPVILYRWILERYAAAGDLILDTHVGSGSSIVACIEGGFNYYGCEIDKEYYEAAKKRIGRAFRKYELEFADEAV
jgi:site-specific DNA-methyltransferase (adenine-specific)